MKKKIALLISCVMAGIMIIGSSINASAGETPDPYANTTWEIYKCLGDADPVDDTTQWVDAEEYINNRRDYRSWLGAVLSFDENHNFTLKLSDKNVTGTYRTTGSALELAIELHGANGEEMHFDSIAGKYIAHSSFWFVFKKADDSGEDNDDKDNVSSKTAAHTHNYEHQILRSPSRDSDGEEAEVCTICGEVKNRQPLSAMGYTLYEYAVPLINAAKPGQTVTLEFGEWNSFPKSFMEKLVEKSANGSTFVFKYKWNHTLQTITIPAGTPIDLNFDYYGPAKMAELYGLY